MNTLRGSTGSLVVLFVTVMAACDSAEDPMSTSTSGTTGDSSSGSSNTGSGTSTTGTGQASADGTSSAMGTTTSGTTGPDADTTAGTTDPAATDDCPPGTEGCPCNAESCDADLVCIDDVCQAAMACDFVDPGEPNDDEANATDLGEITDDDSDGDTLVGVLETPEDEDWYSYIGDDDFGSTVDPTRILTTTGGLRLCKFFECLNGLPGTEFTCPPGTQAAMSTMARPGCCGSTGFDIDDLNCSGIDESALVVIRLDQAAEACVEYSLDYHF